MHKGAADAVEGDRGDGISFIGKQGTWALAGIPFPADEDAFFGNSPSRIGLS
jgi:hypothetical protein